MARRGEPKTPYDFPAWKVSRRRCLERDRRICQVRRDGCTGTATEADHIKPWRDGGEWFDLENLRASCKHCNISRASHQKHHNGWRRRTDVEILLVWGDPEHLPADHIDPQPDDVVICLDRLARAFGSADDSQHAPQHAQAAALAWAAVLAKLKRGELNAARVWLLSTDPDAPQTLPGELITLHTPKEAANGEGSQGLDPGRWQ